MNYRRHPNLYGGSLRALLLAHRRIGEEAISDFRDVSRQLHDRYGLVPLRPTDPFITAEALNIVALPRPFQPDAGALDERYVFVGPSISPRSDASGFPLDLLADTPTLYVSLGTVFNANPEFFDAWLRCLRR